MGRYDLALVRHVKFGEDFIRSEHGLPIAAAPHDDTDQWFRDFTHAAIFSVTLPVVNAFM
jgi:hypothetical protein